MSPLAIFLLITLLLSAIFFVFLWRVNSLTGIDKNKIFKRTLMIWTWVIFVCLGSIVLFFIGTTGTESPQVPNEKERRVAHTGYYFSRNAELTLKGKYVPKLPADTAGQTPDVESAGEVNVIQQLSGMSARAEGDGAAPPVEGFDHSALGPDERITIKPLWEGGKANKWRIVANAFSKPLRLETVENGASATVCVNLAEERWLDAGDKILITLETGGEKQFVEIEWTAGTKYFWPVRQFKNAYYFSQGTVVDGQLSYSKSNHVLLSEARIQDGYGLENLVKNAKREVLASLGTIDKEWWNVFTAITLVRERRGDIRSRIGIMIEDDLIKRTDLQVQKNYQGADATVFKAPDGEFSAEISATTKIHYGLGFNNALELELSTEAVEDEIWGNVVYVSLAHPPLWPLPPTPTEDFIITSTDDYIPLDGYFIDVGKSSHAFYAKAKLTPDLNEISVNDGKNIKGDKSDTGDAEVTDLPRKFPIGKQVSLGDFQQGVLMTLLETRSGISYAGFYALLFLLLNAVAVSWGLWRYRNANAMQMLSWHVVWSSVLTILTVRLVLAYRVALLSPLDASPKEIQNVFQKGLEYSLWAIAIFAGVALVLPWLVAGWKRIRNKNGLKALGTKVASSKVTTIVWGLLIVGWSVAGTYFGSNQAFLGFRINIIVHILIVLGLTIFAGKALETGWSRWLVCIIIFLALGIQIFLVKDAGFIIYGISLVIGIWLMFFWNSLLILSSKWHRRILAIPIILFPILFVAGLLYLPSMLLPYVTGYAPVRSAMRPAIPSTTFYRLASFTDTEEDLLTARSGDNEANLNVLLDNSRQDWQMLLYAAQGASDYKGYGQAPLSKRGMTYSTSMADCVFSTYLLAEHGKAASLLLLLFYLVLAAICVFGGWHLPADMRHRSFPLLVIGGFFGYNALYMGAANIGLTVFTGQNIPFLGLYSGSDFLQGLILAGIAGLLMLSSDTDSTPDAFRRKNPMGYWITLTFGGSILVWVIAVGVQMIRIGADENYLKDHNFSAKIFKDIKENLPPTDETPSKRQNSAWRLDGDQIVPNQSAPVEEVEKQYVKQFNDRVDKFNPNGGLYYLENAARPTPASPFQLKVNDRFFLARSPFKDVSVWKGRVLAGGDRSPTINALGGSRAFNLASEGAPQSVDLSRPLSESTTQAITLVESGNRFCDLRREGERLRLDPRQRSNEWAVYVDGRRIDSPVDLEPLNIVVIERKNPAFRRNFIYLGPTPPILAYVRWRNGEQRRMFPDSQFPLAYLVGKAGDVATQFEKEAMKTNAATEQKMQDEMRLTLDISLHRELQQELDRYAETHPNYRANRLKPNRLALTAMDAFSGKVLALPSWPVWDPGKTDYETLANKIPDSVRARFEQNHNFTNHVAGSTIKPVIFSTMATVMRSVRVGQNNGIDLARTTIFNRSSANRGELPPGTVHPHFQIGKINIGMWDCNSDAAEANMSNFLIHSLDYPEGVIGMLGMVTDENEVSRVFVPSRNQPDIAYGQETFALDFTRVAHASTAFTLEDQNKGGLAQPRGGEIVNQTVLFKGLSSVFDFRKEDGDAGLRATCRNFIPMFDNEHLNLDKNDYLDNVIPPQINFASGDFQDLRGSFISCLLGGGDCGFNNIRMAQSAARLATGLRVSAQLEDFEVNPVALPSPLSDGGWRNLNIIDPLERVGTEGTAAELRSLAGVQAGYKAIYKTGTILEGKDEENRESETLLFVVGRWENNGFVPGRTIAGYLYMEKSKHKKQPNSKSTDTNMKKFDFAAPFIRAVVRYLIEKENAASPRPRN